MWIYFVSLFYGFIFQKCLIWSCQSFFWRLLLSLWLVYLHFVEMDWSKWATCLSFFYWRINCDIQSRWLKVELPVKALSAGSGLNILLGRLSYHLRTVCSKASSSGCVTIDKVVRAERMRLLAWCCAGTAHSWRVHPNTDRLVPYIRHCDHVCISIINPGNPTHSNFLVILHICPLFVLPGWR